MRITVDLGFWSAVTVAVVCVVVPVIGFVIRHKWRRAVARSEEVKRLLILAAEESAMFESEEAYQYDAVPVPRSNQCAVCFCPTTTRCSRCKTVHYCSGKCQILHWRQGHKEQCNPPSTTHQTDGLVRDLGKNVAEQDYNGFHDEQSQVESTDFDTSSEKAPLSDISFSPEISCGKDDKIRIDSPAEGDTSDSNAKLSSNSFSGFSVSISGRSESSDDSSVCEIFTSKEHKRPTSADATFDIAATTSNDNSTGATISLTPKFASLVDSVDVFPTAHKLSEVRHGLRKEENKLPLNGSSGVIMETGSTIDPSTVSSGFWDKTLDSRGIKDNAKSDSLPSNSDDGCTKSAGNSMPHTGLVSSENKGMDSSVSEDTSSIHNLQSGGSNISNLVVNSPGNTLKSAEIKWLPNQGLFPYNLFVKLYHWNRVELLPAGLLNCGNSCYANAVLQCLAFTPPLTAYFLQGLHSKSCVNKKCFACEFESLILKSKGTNSPLSPMGILSQLQFSGSQLGNGREEDAHEFLRHAIETMQSVFLKESEVNASDSLTEETNLMGLTFGGYLRSKIKCMKCGGKSEHQDRMMDLTVEVEGEIATLEEALQRYTSTEILDGENKYHCFRCKSYEKAKKKLTVSEAPNVLTIALKRFQTGKFGKLNKPVQFPEILDFAPFMSGTSDRAPIYRLYGVVVHLDVLNASFSGHYVCYVKNFQNKWFKVDDSVVSAVELERVLTKGAYMLFYARCSPRAPRLIRNQILSSDSKSKVNAKAVALKSRHASTDATDCLTRLISLDGPPMSETLISKLHLRKRIFEDDSSSDNLSLFSNNTDDGSCSTDSNPDSTSTDDLVDYISGHSGRGGDSSMLRNSDSNTWSSASNMHSTRSEAGTNDSVLQTSKWVATTSHRFNAGERWSFAQGKISGC